MYVHKVTKLIFLAVTVIGMSGCAMKSIHTSIPSKQSNQSANVDVKRELKYPPLSIFPEITTIVYINNEVALKGILSGNNEGRMESIYNGKKLELDCAPKTSVNATCTVHLDNVRMGEYFFPIDGEHIKRVN